MIADALRADIERFVPEVERENALFLGALEGSLTAPTMAHYLHNVRHLVRHTPFFLERARDRASALGQDGLASYFAEKLVEEQGHDRWADSDLKRLRARFGTEAPPDIAPALLDLLRFIDETIERDPTLYLAYILFAELHIVLMGPRWLDLLEKQCGFEKEMFTVIGFHAELDREHTAEGMEAIDRLVTEPAKLPAMRATLRTTMDLFQAYCADVVRYRVSSPSSVGEPCIPSSPA